MQVRLFGRYIPLTVAISFTLFATKVFNKLTTMQCIFDIGVFVVAEQIYL